MNEPISWDRKKKIFMHANQASPGMGKKTLKLQSFCQLKENPEILAINELLQCFDIYHCFYNFFSFQIHNK